MNRRIPFSIIALLLVSLFAGGLPAQFGIGCPTGDDGFNTGCCQPVQPNLPNFPSVTTTGLSGCLLDCSVEATHQLSVSLGAPNFVLCDLAFIPITITPTGPGPMYSGTLLAKYSRTFLLTDAAGINRQVWRFVVNGDLSHSPLIPPTTPCPVPACVNTNQGRVHWWGTLDYQCEMSSNPPLPPLPFWRIRMDLNHAPGCIQHAPVTAVPLSGAAAHPERSYHLLAPGNFTFAPVPEPQGPTYAEALRISGYDPAVGYTCLSESPLDPMSPGFTTVSANCQCIPGSAPPLWKHQHLAGYEQCVGVTNPYFNIAAPVFGLPTGFVSLTLGSWSGASFPGGQDLVVHFGVLYYADVCRGNFPYHVVTGSTTSGVTGSVFNQGPVGPGFFTSFTDLANHKGFTTFPGTIWFLPTFGSVSWSNAVWNLNQ